MNELTDRQFMVLYELSTGEWALRNGVGFVLMRELATGEEKTIYRSVFRNLLRGGLIEEIDDYYYQLTDKGRRAL
jgi:hypothetical protein